MTSEWEEDSPPLNFDLISITFLIFIIALLTFTTLMPGSNIYDDGVSRIVVRSSFATITQLLLYSATLGLLCLALRAQRRRRVIGAIALISCLCIYWVVSARIDMNIEFIIPIGWWMEESWSVRMRIDRTFLPTMFLQVGLFGLSVRTIASNERLTWRFSLRDLAWLVAMLCAFAALLRFVWVNL